VTINSGVRKGILLERKSRGKNVYGHGNQRLQRQIRRGVEPVVQKDEEKNSLSATPSFASKLLDGRECHTRIGQKKRRAAEEEEPSRRRERLLIEAPRGPKEGEFCQVTERVTPP